MSEIGAFGFALFGVGLVCPYISATYWLWTMMPWSAGFAGFVYRSLHMTSVGHLIVSMTPVPLKHR